MSLPININQLIEGIVVESEQLEFKENQEFYGNTNSAVKYLLSDGQRRVYDLIKINPELSNKEMAERLKISARLLSEHLKALERKKVIRNIGTEKRMWKIILH